MSAVEIEDALHRHPDVSEIAVIGVPDELRGQVVKAFVVSERQPDDADFESELQAFARERLGQHEYPRQVELVPELPKTPAGKVNRKVLRDREAARAADQGGASPAGTVAPASRADEWEGPSGEPLRTSRGGGGPFRDTPAVPRSDGGAGPSEETRRTEDRPV